MDGKALEEASAISEDARYSDGHNLLPWNEARRADVFRGHCSLLVHYTDYMSNSREFSYAAVAAW